MGNNMQTFGGMISFTDSSKETIDIVNENLESTNYYGPSGPVRKGDFAGATSWIDAFAGMEQVLHPLENGLHAILGYDDRYYDPQPFLTAADAFIAPGSWMAYRDENLPEGFVYVLFKPTSGPIERHALAVSGSIPTHSDMSFEGTRKFAYDLLIEQGFAAALAPTGVLPAWALLPTHHERFHARRKPELKVTPLSMPSRRS